MQYIGKQVKQSPKLKVILTGDFNDTPSSRAFAPFATLRHYPLGANKYSYKFEGRADQLDYFFSTGFKDGESMVNVALVNARYTNGASDHNPVLLDIKIDGQAK